MGNKSVFVLLVLIILLTTNPAPSAIRYNITDLGTLPGYEESHPWFINNNGQIVGEVLNWEPAYTGRAVLFDATGSGNNIDLGTLGGVNSWAASINNNGQIVGWADTNEVPPITHAAIFDANGTGNNKKISNEGWAASINNFGLIAGAEVNNSGVEVAALFDYYDPNNKIALGTISGFSHSRAYSINDNGRVVGFAYNSLFSDSRAVLFDSNYHGNNIDLGKLEGEYSMAYSINNYGQIVGHAGTAPSAQHATLFDPSGEGNNIDLGPIGSEYSAAYYINNKTQIVGQAVRLHKYFAVLFDNTGNNKNIDLNNLINPALGWYLFQAMCINDNGWIVGRGINSNGDSRAFLLTPATLGDFEPDRDVDLKDFAVFAAAWQSKEGEPNWNIFCDISSPEDGVVNELDLAIFCSNWLAQQ